MSQSLTCPHGHRWQAATEANGAAACPVCGAAGTSAEEADSATWRGPAEMELPPLPRGLAVPRAASGNDWPELPGYELLAELGRGGMGVVYKARQKSLNRIVALKMILPGAALGSEELARFHIEAEAVARLQHPHIVQIHEVGTHGRRPFLCLEYVDGGSLARQLAGQPQPPADAAQLAETLARTVHFAHTQGVIHRDLKPANVLLVFGSLVPGGLVAQTDPPILKAPHQAPGTRHQTPVPKIADFGLAKRLDTDSGQTKSGVAMGTPSYMAPEQARGDVRGVGPAADIHALGAILYEMLTGRPPFLGASAVETLDQVVHDEPLPLRRLQPRLPRDLDTICLKCLQKEPSRRYATAAELADDLQRFGAGEPIRARPVSLAERGWKWAKRRPAVAAMGLVTLAALVGLAIGGLKYNVDLREAFFNVKEERDKATKAQAITQTTLADMNTSFGLEAGQKLPGQAVLWFANAAALSTADEERALANRVRMNAWGRRIPLVRNALLHPNRRPWQMAFHPSDRYLLVISRAGTPGDVAIWDLETELALQLGRDPAHFRTAVWNPAGDLLALAGYDGRVDVLRFPSFEPLAQLSMDGPVLALAFSTDGRRLAIGGKQARVWDVRSKDYVTPGLPHLGRVVHVAFNRAGTRLATAASDSLARVFDLEKPDPDGKPVFPPVPHVDPLGRGEFRLPVHFIDNDQGLLSVSSDRELAYRDPATGRVLRTFASHYPPVHDVAMHRLGKAFAVCGYRGLDVYETVSKRPGWSKRPHQNSILAAAFSPESQTLVTASGDRRIGTWKRSNGDPEAPLHPQLDEVVCLAYSADGLLLATGQTDGLVRVWLPERADSGGIPLTPICQETMSRLSPDGRHLVLCGNHLTSGLLATEVRGTATGEPAGPELKSEGMFNNAVFTADGKQLITLHSLLTSPAERDPKTYRPGTAPGRIHFWNWAAGTQVYPPLDVSSEPLGVACSPDGRFAVVVCAAGQVLLLEATTGKLLGQATYGPSARVTFVLHDWVRFAPDGQSVAVWGPNNHVAVFETATLKPRFAPLQHRTFCTNARFSPDGKVLATASLDKTVRLWNADTGAEACPPLTHPDWIFSLAFSHDGDRLVTACRDHLARLWDWREGRVLRSLEHQDEVFDAAFSPDGRWIFTATRDGVVQAWDSATGKPVLPPFLLNGSVLQLNVTPNGHKLVAAGNAKAVRIFHLVDLFPEGEWDGATLVRRAEILSDQRVDGGKATNLTSEEWLSRWKEQRANGAGLVWTPADEIAWRSGQLDACERSHTWSIGVRHADKLLTLQPGATQWLIRRGKLHHLLQDYVAAERDLAQVLERQPGHDEARQRRSRALYQLNRTEEALKEIDQVIARQPRDAEAIGSRAVIYMRLKQREKALADLHQAITLDSKQPGSWHNRGILYAQLGQVDKAIADLTRAIELRPDHAPSYTERGGQYLRQGQLGKATADFAKAAELVKQ